VHPAVWLLEIQQPAPWPSLAPVAPVAPVPGRLAGPVGGDVLPQQQRCALHPQMRPAICAGRSVAVSKRMSRAALARTLQKGPHRLSHDPHDRITS
jgi:hypothetical protein